MLVSAGAGRRPHRRGGGHGPRGGGAGGGGRDGVTPQPAAAHLILYVADQAAAAAFFAAALGFAPRLDVPGMTEFALPGGAVLGLMPEDGVRRLLGDALPDPAGGAGVPRAELYLMVPDPAAAHARAVAAGARELSPLLPRGWGHRAAYCLTADGHVVAFASA
ncbi:MAG: glyoxalase [Thermoleophilia bacterium]|nr:glyoxalase [Thermoleophilia bacterium]